MAKPQNRTRKHFQLNAAKLKRARKALCAKTETETIELALSLVIAEHQKNRLTHEANERFVESGINIKNVCRALADEE